MDLKEKWLCLNCGITENEEHFLTNYLAVTEPIPQSIWTSSHTLVSEKHYTWPYQHMHRWLSIPNL